MTLGLRTTLKFLDDLRKAGSLPKYGEQVIAEHTISSKAWMGKRTYRIIVTRLNHPGDK